MLAIISGSVAFFAPEIGIEPLSGRPPTMRMRSMPHPVPPPNRRIIGLILGLVRYESGGIVGRPFAASRSLPGLRLPPPEVFPKRRLEPRGARIVAFADAGAASLVILFAARHA